MLRTLSILLTSLFVTLGAAAQTQDFKEYNLGVAAFRAKNYEAAREHWTLATASNNSNAYNNLGFLLYNGLGGNADPVRAVALWRDASTMGNRESQLHLGYAYEAGKGTLRNAVEAYAWLRCAENSYRLTPAVDDADTEAAQDARNSVTRVSAKIPEDQRKLAEELARIYIALYSRPEDE
jgi:hypothetical protein